MDLLRQSTQFSSQKRATQGIPANPTLPNVLQRSVHCAPARGSFVVLLDDDFRFGGHRAEAARRVVAPGKPPTLLPKFAKTRSVRHTTMQFPEPTAIHTRATKARAAESPWIGPASGAQSFRSFARTGLPPRPGHTIPCIGTSSAIVARHHVLAPRISASRVAFCWLRIQSILALLTFQHVFCCVLNALTPLLRQASQKWTRKRWNCNRHCNHSL